VEAKEVARYVDAVGASGGGVPPLFAALYCLRPVMAALFDDVVVGVPRDGVIHSEQSLEWGVPVSEGDRIEAVGSIASIQEKRGLILVSLGLRAINQHGESVCTARTVLLQRGSP